MQAAILKTLAYSDIFDYPLRLDEIKKYLIGTKTEEIQIDPKLVGEKDGFYFLKNREKIVELRKKRTQWSKKKWKIARAAANKLKIIPTLKMIGITGTLAMDNCQEDDDIDLLVITGANGLWLTRLLVIFLSYLLGVKRRRPKEKTVKNKTCFNLFLDENYLKIQPENLFLAHEICQVKPIFDKDNTYNRFIKENKWVLKFLPNFTPSPTGQDSNFKTNCLLSFFNNIAFKLQYQYMKKKITNEKVSLHQAFFHPNNLSDKVQKEFENRLLFL